MKKGGKWVFLYFSLYLFRIFLFFFIIFLFENQYIFYFPLYSLKWVFLAVPIHILILILILMMVDDLMGSKSEHFFFTIYAFSFLMYSRTKPGWTVLFPCGMKLFCVDRLQSHLLICQYICSTEEQWQWVKAKTRRGGKLLYQSIIFYMTKKLMENRSENGKHRRWNWSEILLYFMPLNWFTIFSDFPAHSSFAIVRSDKRTGCDGV